MDRFTIKLMKKNLEKSIEKYLTYREENKKYLKDNSLAYIKLIDVTNLLIAETMSHLNTLNEIIKKW